MTLLMGSSQSRSPCLPNLRHRDRAGHPPSCSIEAGTCVHEHDRLGMLHLCRYGLRAPFSQERLRLRDDGRIGLRLRRPAHDGTRAVCASPSTSSAGASRQSCRLLEHI